MSRFARDRVPVEVMTHEQAVYSDGWLHFLALGRCDEARRQQAYTPGPAITSMSTGREVAT
jgi:hypothetical protein